MSASPRRHHRQVIAVSALAALAFAGLPAIAAVTPASAAQTANVYAADTFNRTVASGWGAAELGGTYGIEGGSGVSVTGGQGQFVLPAAVSRTAILTATTTSDTDTVYSVGLSALPTAGSGVYLTTQLRRTAAQSRVEPRIRITTDKKITVGIRHATKTGTITTIAPDVVLPFTAAANKRLMVRTQVEGTGPATARVKVWAMGTVEPSAWTTTGTTTLAAPDGTTAVAAYNASGANTNTVTFDDLTVKAINVNPTASFASTTSDLSLDVNAGGSSDVDGTIAKYDWNFGDGATATGATATHAYTAAGSYPVTVTVTDNRGATSTSTNTVTIADTHAPTAPGAPAAALDATGVKVALRWGASTDGSGSGVRHYVVADNGTDIAVVTAASMTTGELATGTHAFTVRAVDNAGLASAAVAAGTVTVEDVAGTVSALTAAADSSTGITVRWNRPASPVAGIRVYGAPTGQPLVAVTNDLPGNTTSYTATGLTPATGYTYRVDTYNSRGVTTGTTVTATTKRPAPTAPVLSVNAVTETSATLGWTPSTHADTYAIYHGTTPVATVPASTRTFTVTGLNPATGYNFRVEAVGDSTTASNTVAVTTKAVNVAPTAAFNATTTNLNVAVNAATSQDPDGVITAYAWDYGDGSSGTGATSAHTYATAGTYTITLTVTDDRGARGTHTTQTTVTSGKPSAANTGVRPGSQLTQRVGNWYIDQANTVIENMDIVGKLTIRAANVTVRNSIVRGNAVALTSGGEGAINITHANATNFLLEDVTVLPQTPNVRQNGVNVNQPGTFKRMNISGTVDGIMMFGSGITVQDSYLHDFHFYAVDPSHSDGSHNDGIQHQAGVGNRIIGNTISGANNAAIMVTQDAGTTASLAISGNWLDGGACSVNYGSDGALKTGLVTKDNRFGRAQRNVGCAIIRKESMSPLDASGNVWDDNGSAVAISRG